MELALFVYLAGIVGGIAQFFAIGAWASAVLFLIYAMNSYDNKTKVKMWILAVPFTLGLISNIIPSEKTMYLMFAGYTTQQVVQSETGDKALKVINAKLDEYLEYISKATKEKK